MSTTGSHWTQSLRAAFRAGHRDKPKRHDIVHHLTYLDDARMAREMGHL